MKVHYERYLGAENWARMTGMGIPEALKFLYDGENLILPERNHDQTVAFERRCEWNMRKLRGEVPHHMWGM